MAVITLLFLFYLVDYESLIRDMYADSFKGSTTYVKHTSKINKSEHIHNNEKDPVITCRPMDGSMEYSQFLRAWGVLDRSGRTPSVPSDLLPIMQEVTNETFYMASNFSSRYKYKVKSYLYYTSSVVKFVVTESYLGKLTHGGSSFLTHIKGSQSVAVCPYDDYFNGTYTICCPVIEAKTAVSISLQYVNYTAFYHFRLEPVSRVVYSWNATVRQSQLDMIDVQTNSCQYGEIYNYGYWKKNNATVLGKYRKFENSFKDLGLDNNQWTWYVNGCPSIHYSKQEVAKCLTSKVQNKLTIIGDSHMRLVFQYVLECFHLLTPGLASVYHSGKKIKNIQFK